MHDIFLSYSRTDTETMQKVKQTLLDADFTVWTDEGIEPGTIDWQDSIDKAIQDSKVFVCILSPDARKSRWVRAELQRAEWYKKLVYLILARGEEVQSIPMGYERHQWIDIRTNSSYLDNMARLTRVIQIHINKPSPTEIQQVVSSTGRQVNLPSILGHYKSKMPAPFAWCYIPGGEVTIASGGYVPEGGKSYYVDAFYMAKYPVTNAQYAQFIASDGYLTETYWTKAGWELCKKHKWTQPRYFHDTKWIRPTHPIVGVSWYEAIAFCNWLNTLIEDNLLTLPTEQQWQRAAQGDDTRRYPWGNDWDSWFCNNNVGRKGIGETTAVDKYTDGESPYHVIDMAGNVDEWCLTEYYSGVNKLEDKIAMDMKQSNVWRVLRGGSWDDLNSATFHTSFRGRKYPDSRSYYGGFRVSLSKM